MRRPGSLRTWRVAGSLAVVLVIAAGLASPIALAANTPPVAHDQQQDVALDGLTLTLAADDADGDALSFAIVSPPDHGSLGDCSSGVCDYTPDPGFEGQATFTWKANDGLADSNVATFTITISPQTTGGAPTHRIVSAGPLTRVEISNDLACAVDHSGDASPEFFGDHACATAVAVGGVLYRPADVPSGDSAAPFTAFTPVSQSEVLGTGTQSDPAHIVTVVTLGTTGLRLTEHDAYVIGQETYRTDVTIANTGGSPQTLILYRAGDCYLQNSDDGYGAVETASGAVACVSGVDDGTGNIVPGKRIQQWYPLSADSAYFHAGYDDVWARIGSQAAFPNTCQCTDLLDNGAGLSWTVTVPAGGEVTRSQLTGFSPLGTVPMTIAQAAGKPSVSPGGQQTFTLTLTNPNKVGVTVTSISDVLPDGFQFVAGSSSGTAGAGGAGGADPAISGQTLTWTGSFAVAAGASITLTFTATAPLTDGTFTNQASATAEAPIVVVAAGPAAVTTIGGAPALAFVLPGPFDLSYAPQDLARSFGLTFLLMLLVAAPTPLFNNTLEHNRDELRHLLRLDRLPKSRLGGLLTTGWIGIGLYLVLAAILYTLLDLTVPGPDGPGIFIGWLVALVLINLAVDLPRDRYLWRRFKAHGQISVAQWTLILAALCVLITRLTSIQPGYVYGIVGAVVFAGPLTRDDEGQMAWRAALALLGLAVGAWLLRVPIDLAAGRPPAGPALFIDKMLVAVFVAGVEGLVFGLIPIRFMLGHPLSGWRRWRWLGLWAAGILLFAHVILYPVSDYEPDPGVVGIVTVFVTVLIYGAVAVGFWWYFRERERKKEAAEKAPG